jgi:prepilin-type processing-associated H-X9-DG protein
MTILHPRSSAAATDGLSNTLAMGEKLFNQNYASEDSSHSWMSAIGAVATVASPLNGTDEKSTTSIPWHDRVGFSSLHPGGVQFLMGDGSVRFISETVAITVIRGLGSMNGGEVVSDL